MGSEEKAVLSFIIIIIITYIAKHKVTLQALEIHTKTKPSPEVASYFLWVNAIRTSTVLDSRMGQRELQKTSCRELSEKIQGVKNSIGRREKWLFPNLYGGINQSTEREREHRVCYGKRLLHTTQSQHKSRQKEVRYEPEMLDDEFPDTVQNFIISSLRNQLHHFQKLSWISKHL